MGKSGSLPRWQLCRGISGSFRVEWVAGFVWNQWQPWSGIRKSAVQLKQGCLQSHARDLNERLHESQSAAAQQRTRLETLEETVNRLQQELDGGTQQREGLQADLNQAEKNLAICEQRVIHLNEQCEMAIDRSRLLGNENRDLMQEKAMLQGQLKQLQRSPTK